ncbi:class 1b ribonucleoside-diphosphate reductase subunit alpha [Staphylococcus agnetis]|uniref:Ribonucleoside-diphosphate reductase n=1 Tax=Staphylococcus agnetis TaxID=985762 RepID=A0ABX3Z2J5_9STAP|nr:class 1b ribonucleoside-diphosphate reductase subunit alpha [Staphylococcus agnetis]MDG4943886.1 class 1b ribonucleoside-diphosphate reductase subunit alpha [Staphylococcus agnetis]OSP22544.1 ribonucleotide-diphosphate reductase subunit alpha [Staphylococcus agnetis]OSP23165.1 ribonucleotide-diphosphate reductase subunit alpha [Staphylococcus agnetis]OTW30562.1 ribonucleotide-diphosphate reductase subunit alpha [Staphylococcus agnetis]
MNYIELNNQMLQRDNITGQFKLEKDKEATKDYFLNNINLNTVFFHTLKEKLDYLVENDYYEKEPIEKYSYKDLKKLYKYVYNKKFRFESFMAAQMFYERYALRTNDGKRILERYEDRIVANAIVLGDGDIEKAFDYAKLLINQEYQPATPTFMNLLKKRGGNYVSCFLLEVDDSLNDLNAVEGYAKQLSKLGGGVSLNLSKIRAKGESIQNIEGVASGVVPFMKSLDQSARWINQLGSRQGAFSVYLNAFHADIYDFLDTKRISGDEDIRCKTLSLGVVIPDKFIELAAKDKMGYLFYPHNVKQVYGTHFDEMDITKMYDELVDNPAIKKKQFNPRQLMSYIGSTLFESGYPYLMFSDNVNRVHANNNVSKVKFSNLCSEVLQYSQVSEHTDYGLEDKLGLDISCNLGSLNIVNAMKSEDFGKTIALSIDALNEVSRISNIANAPTIKKANEISHSIGLGAMNLHGYLAQNKIKYDSKEGLEFADTFFRMVKYYGLKRSMDIAKETGEKYYGFEGSKYASGEQLKNYFEQKPPKISDKIAVLFEGHHIPTQEDWKKLSDDIQKYGLYNSYITAVAPTGSISYIQNSTASILPVVERIEERPQGKSKVYFPAPNLSAENWFFYKEAYDFDQRSIADMVATIQKHVDQGISFTYFMKDTDTTRDINKLHLYAYSKGIKTMYYMRTKRTQMEECLSCQV